MEENKELSALFKLIDDPDEEIFGAVSNRIIDYGKGVIPNLEHLWETSMGAGIQERIELLIHKLHFQDLQEEFHRWNTTDHPDLLTGALLASRFQYPELPTAHVYQDIEKLRRNIWLELNTYLTPLEQVNVMTSILYNYFNLKGEEISYRNTDEFLIHKVLESKKGNSISNGILYLVLSELLDVPIRAVNIPRQFILGYFKMDYDFERHQERPNYHAEFFIDPMCGQIFTHKEVATYCERIHIPFQESFYRQLPTKTIIRLLLDEMSKCYDSEKSRHMQTELQALAKSLVV